jgi:small subunit ribosomal protein S13
MARIAGVDLNRAKRVEAALPYIYGIGPNAARRILAVAAVDPDTRVKDLTEEEVARLRQVIEDGHKVEGALRAETAANIKRLIAVNSYRGLRHKKGLPAHGQRTKTNARTRKGPRKTVGRKRKKK